MQHASSRAHAATGVTALPIQWINDHEAGGPNQEPPSRPLPLGLLQATFSVPQRLLILLLRGIPSLLLLWDSCVSNTDYIPTISFTIA